MLDRFMDKVSPEPNSGCWLWESSIDTSGYGTFWLNGCVKKAHRISFEIHFGNIPPELQVCHKCDNRICVNPDHLFLGTLLDNMRDRNSKGRNARGSSHSRAKLNEQDVINIRKSVLNIVQLSKIYGVGTDAISRIRARKSWKHVA